MPENAGLDQVPKVKYLVGERMVVYGQYCGDNCAENRSTCGPYAKVEMKFTSVHEMHLFEDGPNSILTVTFSSPAAMFLQLTESTYS